MSKYEHTLTTEHKKKTGYETRHGRTNTTQREQWKPGSACTL